MCVEEIVRNVTPLAWWTSQKNIFSEEEQSKFIPVMKQLFGDRPSLLQLAAVERVFFTFGIVKRKLRNRLGIEKPGYETFKYYNNDIDFSDLNDPSL
ncbi:unnamed protein product [Parnassius apollo]|uniref:(apollo) hypothetical protein n=1 Tax=Parnassius apollo TaxID=110799 RepID=A0A8S3WB63_PARAO|nr:unnamed protein product [Parnassius apollo]